MTGRKVLERAVLPSCYENYVFDLYGTLVDIHTVKIDPSLPREERIREYMRQIKNPYCYLEGKTVVKISFADTERTLEDCVRGYLSGV